MNEYEFFRPYQEHKGNYTICVKGHLSADWADKFAGLDIKHDVQDDHDISVLRAYIRDDSEYNGILHALRHGNHDVISITHD